MNEKGLKIFLKMVIIENDLKQIPNIEQRSISYVLLMRIKQKLEKSEDKRMTINKYYILLKPCPQIGKEEGDYYNGEFKQSIEELIKLGVIKEEKTEGKE
jgi:hypothetical protein